MDEIIENIRQEAKKIYEEQMDLLKLRKTTIAKLQNEIKDISKEQSMIADKNDDFYKYLEAQKSAKTEEFLRLANNSLARIKAVEDNIPIIKEKFINSLNEELVDIEKTKDTRYIRLKIQEIINELNKNFTIENIENFYKSLSPEISESKETEIVEETEITEPVTEVEDTAVEQVAEPVIEVEDTAVEQVAEPVIEVEDTAVEQDTEPVTEVEDTAVEQDTNPSPTVEDIDRILFTPAISSMGNVQTTNSKIEGVNVFYTASTDQYVVENPYTKWQKIINRTELKKLDKALVAEKTDRSIDDLKYVHTDILQVLRQYDKENATNTSTKYFKIAKIGKAKKARKEEIKEAKINIHYDLTGLYDLNGFEEKDELLEMANLAKKAGIATVKKGLRVTMRESLDKLGSRFESLIPFSNHEKVKSLPPAQQEIKVDDNKTEHKTVEQSQLQTEPNTVEQPQLQTENALKDIVKVELPKQETDASVVDQSHKQKTDTTTRTNSQKNLETKIRAEKDTREKAVKQALARYNKMQKDFDSAYGEMPCTSDPNLATDLATAINQLPDKPQEENSGEREF